MIDYESIRRAISGSDSIESLKKTRNMPPVPACKKNQNYVFISYSHKDYKAVYTDLLEFHKNGLRYWYDEGLPAGEDWDSAVEAQLKNPHCAGVIFYMSENLFLSRSVSREIEIVAGNNGDYEGKNYFCINLSGMPPMKILHTIQSTHTYEELDQSGFYDWESTLKTAFSNKATYISKTNTEDVGHIFETLKQVKARFNVIADGLPISDDAQIRKLSKALEIAETKLDFIKSFPVSDGVLLSYKGANKEVFVPEFISDEYVFKIGELAFADCAATKIVLPDSIANIGKSAFGSCHALTAIELPDSIMTIADLAFDDCISLAEINLPDSIIAIGRSAFSCCLALRSIRIPNNISAIKEFTFDGCCALTGVTIPGGVKHIMRSAFEGCTSLTDIIYLSTKADWAAIDKTDSWDKNTGCYIIHCTDGDIPKK